ncbi:helix-hairpin-helix domain-containing protein [Woodsholea maritima]|uniref:helix-hairpin-helix domain-containing protein n=1 Tax=Woodsholea maritima TaxID=240237 RepID=UPI00039CD3D9|nr:helix-hairpin-helix domain-containing protein [Woodsholea maritima]
MLWLTWQMWILLSLAFLGGIVVGWMARGQSDEPDSRAIPAPVARRHTPAQAQDKEAIKTGASGTTGSNAPYGLVRGAASEPEIMSAPSDHREDTPIAAHDPEAPQSPTPSFNVIEGGGDGASEESAIPKAPAASGDDLTQIRGLGPKAAMALNEAGVKTLSQIAGWGAEDIDHFDRLIGARGRIEREDWVGQAKALIQ